jgi:hypothetical protein
MKYFFLLIVLLSCKSDPKVVEVHTPNDTTAATSVKRDTSSIDIHNPYETGKDTIRLNKVMDEIFNFPEVKAINEQINKNSKGAHGVSIMVEDNFDGDTSYYHFRVGDNSHEDRYENIYDFLLDKETGEIKAYDNVSDLIMTLKDWRKNRK